LYGMKVNFNPQTFGVLRRFKLYTPYRRKKTDN